MRLTLAADRPASRLPEFSRCTCFRLRSLSFIAPNAGKASVALQGSSVGSCAVHVGSDTTGNACGLLVASVFDTLGRNTDNRTTGREFLILRHQSAGGDDRALAYRGSVENRGAHPDEAAVLYLAAVRTIALWPITQSSPMMAGDPGSACSTQPS